MPTCNRIPIDELWEQHEEEVESAAELLKARGGLKSVLRNRDALLPRFHFVDPVGYYDTSIGSISILLPFFESIVVPIYHPLNPITCREWYGIDLDHLLELTRMGIVNPLFDFNFNCEEYADTVSVFRPLFGEFKFKLFSVLFELLLRGGGLRNIRRRFIWQQYYDWIKDPLIAQVAGTDYEEFMLWCRSTYYPEQVLLSLLMLDYRPIVRQFEEYPSPLWGLMTTRENYRLVFHYLSYFLIDPILHPMFSQKMIDASEVAMLERLPLALESRRTRRRSGAIFLPSDFLIEFADEYVCRLPTFVDDPVNYKERLARSDNVKHAHRVLESFSKELGQGSLLEGIREKPLIIRNAMDQLNSEISTLQKRARATEAVLKFGASVTSLVTSGLATQALASSDVARALTYAGVCAASLLAREESSKVAKFLQGFVSRKRTAFLIWKKSGG